MKDLFWYLATRPPLLVFLGGGLGSWCRYALSRWVARHGWAADFPWATLTVNVLGACLLGLLAVLFLERMSAVYRPWLLLLGTGFCGGFTTFSTFSWETYELARAGRSADAGLYVLLSLAAGLAGVFLGAGLVQLLWPRG